MGDPEAPPPVTEPPSGEEPRPEARLGLPGEEDDLFDKLLRHGVISESMAGTLRRMKGLRNLLVHEYGRVNAQVVFETIQQRLGDCEAFKGEILAFLRNTSH